MAGPSKDSLSAGCKSEDCPYPHCNLKDCKKFINDTNGMWIFVPHCEGSKIKHVKSAKKVFCFPPGSPEYETHTFLLSRSL